MFHLTKAPEMAVTEEMTSTDLLQKKCLLNGGWIILSYNLREITLFCIIKKGYKLLSSELC